jgi:hypothetical protein
MDDRELVARSCATPWNYAKAKLGMNLTPKQAAVLKDWFVPGSRVACRCGNEVGKTSRLAVASILHHAEQLKGMVVSTAGVARQVKTQLIPNLQTYEHLYPGWKFLADRIVDPKGRVRYLGFTAANEGTWQGFHNLDGPLGIILDESAIIPDKLIIAAEERCNPTRFLIMGSPLDPTGQFYKNCTSQAKYYKQHKITQFDCPWISKAVIERRIEKYGAEHPIVLSSIYAEFCLKVEGALLSLTEWEECIEHSPQPIGIERHVFLDFAAGRNKNAIGVRVGNRAWIEKSWPQKNTMAAIGEFLAVLNRLAKPPPLGIRLKPHEVEGDADGMGTVFIDALTDAGWPILRFHSNSAPLGTEDYSNRTSEVWNEGACGIRKKEWIIGKPGADNREMNEELKGQIINRKIIRDIKGRLKLESKEDLAKRGVESPDEADALLGAMGPLPMTKSRNIVGGGMHSDEWQEQAADGHGSAGLLPGASC